MAVKTRAELAAEDISIYLPDNATQDIEPTDHRASNVNHADSSLNKLEDNIFPQPLDDSLEYGSDPTAGWDDSAIHDQKLGSKKYIDLRTSPKDFTTYYVSKNGNDVTAQPGNDKLPYLTIQGALDAVALLPFNSKVFIKIFAGSYTEDIVLIGGNYYLYFEAVGVDINGYVDIRNQTSVSLNLQQSKIEYSGAGFVYTARIHAKLSIFGGEIVRSGGLVNQACFESSDLDLNKGVIVGTTFISDSRAAIQAAHYLKFYGCTITGDLYGVFRCKESVFTDCDIKSDFATGTAAVGSAASALTEPNKFHNCLIEGYRGKLDESMTADEFYNCTIKGNLYALGFPNNGTLNVNTLLEGCTLAGVSDCIVISTGSKISANFILQSCFLNAGTGDIFAEPAPYDAGFTGKIISFNNVYNKAFVSANPELLEQNKLVL